MSVKKCCPYCSKKSVYKNGTNRSKQQYRCRSCGYQFTNKSRSKRWVESAYKCYCNGKQTLTELSQ